MKCLIIGATSAIAEHTARQLSQATTSFVLAGRDTNQLEQIADDLRVRGASHVAIVPLDLADMEALSNLVSRSAEELDGLDTVIFAAGTLPDPDLVNTDNALFRQTMDVNATCPMQVFNTAATVFKAQGHGKIVAIGSVAGDRGRAVNYAYGAAKAALETYMSGLRQRLHGKDIQVLLVKPGFVDTPMTASFEKGPLWAQPEKVARDIVAAMKNGRTVIYTPWFWRWIMLVIKMIPEPVFKRLKF